MLMIANRVIRALALGLILLAPPAAASQDSIVLPITGPHIMADYSGLLNDALAAVQGCNYGSTAPANGPSGAPVAYQCWADTSASPSIAFKKYDGASWVTFGVLDTSTHSWTPYRQGAPVVAVATSASAADLTTGTLPAARLPNPTGSSLGGVQSVASTASKWLDSISTSGVPHASQPAFADISGSWSCTQAPALTGDISTSAGSCATAIGATKVTSAMFNADVFSTAHSWGGQQTFTAPILGTPASGTLTNATGLPISTGVSGLGTGVATALAVNVGSVGAPVVNGGALGTPSSGTLTNATGLPVASGISGFGTGIATFLATPSSANLRAALTDEVGTGAAYFVGGALGTPASGTATNLTGLPPSGLTAQGAYTLLGNNSGSSASPAAIDITTLTAKASPVSGDIVLIQDSAASNAFKRTTVGALASAGSVSSFNGQAGAVIYAPKGYIYGLTISNDATSDVTNEIAVDAGTATDDTNTYPIELASALSRKKLNVAWAVGSNAGCLDSGTVADGTYFVWLIRRSDTGVVDVLCSTSPTSPTMPTNYDQKRLIAPILREGGANVRFFQNNDLFSRAPVNSSTSNIGTGATALALQVPTGVKVRAWVNAYVRWPSTAGQAILSSLDVPDTAPSSTVGNLMGFQPAASQNGISYFDGFISTNTSGQIRQRATAITSLVNITTFGWIWERGRTP